MAEGLITVILEKVMHLKSFEKKLNSFRDSGIGYISKWRLPIFFFYVNPLLCKELHLITSKDIQNGHPYLSAIENHKDFSLSL